MHQGSYKIPIDSTQSSTFVELNSNTYQQYQSYLYSLQKQHQYVFQ
jgi:hypothetical protein